MVAFFIFDDSLWQFVQIEADFEKCFDQEDFLDKLYSQMELSSQQLVNSTVKCTINPFYVFYVFYVFNLSIGLVQSPKLVYSNLIK